MDIGYNKRHTMNNKQICQMKQKSVADLETNFETKNIFWKLHQSIVSNNNNKTYIDQIVSSCHKGCILETGILYLQGESSRG